MARFKARPRSQPEALERPSDWTAADYNGDGHLDLAAVNASDVGILLGNGLGSFTLHSNPSSGSGDLIAGVAGDYNGDGKLDLVVSDGASSQAFYFPGNGDGTFGTKITYTTAAGSFGVATADFKTAMAPWTWPSPTDRPTTFPFFCSSCR